LPAPARSRLSVVSDSKFIEGTSGLGLAAASPRDASGASPPAPASVPQVVQAYTGVSKKGYAPYNPRKRNQDALLMEEHHASGSLLFGVFDGHGEAGDLVSRYFTDRYAERVFKHKLFLSNPARALQEELDTIEQELLSGARAPRRGRSRACAHAT
jgi:hypothetical protein